MHFASLDTMLMLQMQTWCTISTDVRTPLKQNCRITAAICSSETELTAAKKFRTSLLNPNQIRSSKIYKIQIHHEVENPTDLNSNPCSSLTCRVTIFKLAEGLKLVTSHESVIVLMEGVWY